MDDFNHISFFSGKGGFDLAAQLMGWNNVAHCEINPFLQTLLKYYWPNAITYGNIKDTDFSVHRRNIDIVTGGFPCQPYSTSGKRLGKDDERHLWPEMLRGIGEIQPPWVVGENVRGLISWNGGLVFDEVQADLEAAGYEVFPFLLPASGVGAPHERYRIWFIAYSDLFRRNRDKAREEGFDGGQGGKAFGNIDGTGCKKDASYTESECKQNTRYQPEQPEYCKKEQIQSGGSNIKDGGSRNKHTSDTDCIRLQQEIDRFRNTGIFDKTFTTDYWENFPSQSPVCFGDDGISARLDAKAVFGEKKIKMDKLYKEWREESIQASGNAVVPQLVLQIFKAIEMYMKTVA